MHYNTEPSPPTGFDVTGRFYSLYNSTISLEWDFPPHDGRPASIVDNYTIFVYPAPLSNSPVTSSPWNATLAHNIPYTFNITATNCAGESEPTSLPDRVLISKFVLKH